MTYSPSIYICNKLLSFILSEAYKELFMMSLAVEWPLKYDDKYQYVTWFTNLGQNLMTSSIWPFLGILLKASSKQIKNSWITCRSSSWKYGAHPCVTRWANFIGPIDNFSAIFQQYHELSYAKMTEQLLKPTNNLF